MSFSVFAVELEEACHVLSALVSAGQARMLRSAPTKTGELSEEMRTDRFSQKHRLPNKDDPDARSEGVQVSSLAIVLGQDRQAAKEIMSTTWGLITDSSPVCMTQEMIKGG